MLSNFAPKWLAVLVRRATVPSSTSVMPAKLYRMKNAGDGTRTNSNGTMHTIRVSVMASAAVSRCFGVCLSSMPSFLLSSVPRRFLSVAV